MHFMADMHELRIVNIEDSRLTIVIETATKHDNSLRSAHKRTTKLPLVLFGRICI